LKGFSPFSSRRRAISSKISVMSSRVMSAIL
jgi:hypothetical protein